MDAFLILIVLAAIGFLIYKKGTKNGDYFSKRNIPHVSPKFLLGTTGGFFMKQHRPNEFYQGLYNKFPKDKIFGLFDFRRPMYMVRDPELLRQMTIKDFDHFEDHKMFADGDADDMFGNSLFMMHGSKWRDMRATLSPAFTGSKMRQMFDLISDCAYGLSEHFKKQAKAGIAIEPEMKDLFSKYTNDVIATSAFGISVNSFENPKNEFFVTGKRMLNFSSVSFVLKVVCMRLLPQLMKALNLQVIDRPSTEFFKTLVLEAMNVREEKKIVRPDMINMLMQVRNGKKMAISGEQEENILDGFATVEESAIGNAVVKREWTDTELVAQCFLFFVAAFNTSSTMLSFTAYELALNPDIQEKLYHEVREMNEKLKGKRLPYDELQNMKYMDMVISEALRKWPPALFTDRLCVKEYKVNDGARSFVIEKGMAFWIPIYAFHRDPKYYPLPEEFNPERFSEENKDSIVPGTYLPFGIGPRNCIGSRFALMEVKAVIYNILLNFTLEPNAKTSIPLIMKKSPANPVPENGIHLTFKLR